MKISIDFDGVQEGKNYVFQFSLTSNGQVIVQSADIVKKEELKKKDGPPSLEDFEEKEKPPQIEDSGVKIKKDFKIESSFDGKIGEGKNI